MHAVLLIIYTERERYKPFYYKISNNVPTYMLISFTAVGRGGMANL